MNRRGFLQAILASGIAPAVIGSGILMPIRSPEVSIEVISTFGNLLTPTMITHEALRILEQSLSFTEAVDRGYIDQFEVSGSTLIVRRPQRFKLSKNQQASIY